VVWDATPGALVAEVHNDGLGSPGIAFSPDGHWLATTGDDDVRVIDARTWRQTATIRGPRIHRLAFHPTGARLLTGATTGDAAIWSIRAARGSGTCATPASRVDRRGGVLV
jgi:WD40 repeat protein